MKNICLKIKSLADYAENPLRQKAELLKTVRPNDTINVWAGNILEIAKKRYCEKNF